MTSLPETTKHRLRHLPQIPHVWEGDRVSVMGIMDNLEPETAQESDCIIWLDGSDGFVRSMDIVKKNMGQEAMIRSLLKAMENPQNPAKPARPHKIVVKDRELQFLLRGVLQDLDIKVDYQATLPLVDELWHNFQNLQPAHKSNIPPKLLAQLENIALSSIWESQPWDVISEEEIIKVDLNHWNVDSLYLCVMGMLGQEFGIILYRSIDSLKNFRQTILELGDSPEDGELETAFLQQDCWFLNFSDADADEDNDLSIVHHQNFQTRVRPLFGSIHPYEGIRSLKEKEEVLPIYIALKALAKFIEEYDQKLIEDTENSIEREYKFKIPLQKKYLRVNLSTLPEFSQELEEIWDNRDDVQNDDHNEARHVSLIDDDLIPDETLISFVDVNHHFFLSLQSKTYEALPLPVIHKIEQRSTSLEFPLVILQTTRPKANHIINQFKEEGGIENLIFAHAYDTEEELEYDLGLLKSKDSNYYLFAQFIDDGEENPPQEAINRLKDQVILFDGYCGVIIAMGAKGVSRGHPRRKDMLALFYTQITDKYTSRLEF